MTLPIRILESDSNKRGDLFGRLMADLFVALGFSQPRMNIHKSGREIDLDATHRIETRKAIAECKATGEKIGGGDINKFVGAVDAELNNATDISAYYISLNGFTETAKEQELGRKRTKIHLLDTADIIRELTLGRLLATPMKATETAGRICNKHPNIKLDQRLELLAHERGWIWCIYYLTDSLRTHYTLVQSDGSPLAAPIADLIVGSDKDCGGNLHQLKRIDPESLIPIDDKEGTQAALDAYHTYLADECGYILLDGLPADSDIGSRKLRLETLFIPLHLDVERSINDASTKRKRTPVGKALNQHPQLAVLSDPGGGKSTLIKRLAVAYSDPSRRTLAEDMLPQKNLFPLFFRCRELRNLARSSFSDLIDHLQQREHIRAHQRAFRSAVQKALLTGNVLLLVDGLDEISDVGDRAAFVCMLRSTLSAYRGTSIVITSRDAGFRHIAAHLAPVCALSRLSPFNSADIRRLTMNWNREVVGDSEAVRISSSSLADTIIRIERIKSLAINPLLLTTLLLVKRWVGTLPTRRAVLYGKAVEVLLMTWNTEGHDPIPEDVALPQLCYVAAEMMQLGIQKLSRKRLSDLIQDARDSLPAELGYVTETVDAFIHRVEDRSSLLMMSGFDVEDGQLCEFFEFRHLTFQEFLAARAFVAGWHSDRSDSDTLTSVLRPHFADEKWREILPLAAVMGGKATELLIRELAESLNASPPSGTMRTRPAANNPHIVLGHCIADEAPAKPDTIRMAIRSLIRIGGMGHRDGFSHLIMNGRYADAALSETRACFLENDALLPQAAFALSELTWWHYVPSQNDEDSQVAANNVARMLSSDDFLTHCEAILLLMRIAFNHRELLLRHNDPTTSNETTIPDGTFLIAFYQKALEAIHSNDHRLNFCATWALVWLGTCELTTKPAMNDIARLADLWLNAKDDETARITRWAITTQPILPRGNGAVFCNLVDDEMFTALNATQAAHEDSNAVIGLLILAWYRGRPYDDETLFKQLEQFASQEGSSKSQSAITALAAAMGRTLPTEEVDTDAPETSDEGVPE